MTSCSRLGRLLQAAAVKLVKRKDKLLEAGVPALPQHALPC